MITGVDALIDRIFGHLRQSGLVIASRRRPGLPVERIRAEIHNLGLHTPSEILEIYSHCDGTSSFEDDRIGDIQIFPGFYWMNLGQAIDTYRAISNSDKWNRAWLPILSDGGGDFYAVICDETSPYFGEVIGFVIGEPEQIAEFKNVLNMFRTIERALSEHVFFASDGRLKADYSRMRAIAGEVQPNFREHEV